MPIVLCTRNESLITNFSSHNWWCNVNIFKQNTAALYAYAYSSTNVLEINTNFDGLTIYLCSRDWLHLIHLLIK